MKTDVFITDGHWRKSLAAVRALGRRHIPVTVGESSWPATAAFSRYCTKSLIYPPVCQTPDSFIEFITTYLRKTPHRMLLAMEDETILQVARHREILSKSVFLPVVSEQQMKKALRKDNIVKLAEKMGIPVPKTWLVDNARRLSELKNTLPYPVVIKPRQGSGAAAVVYVNHAHELIPAYNRVHKHFPWPMIQERIPEKGAGYGASFLMDHNSVTLAAFMHQRLRQYPVSGGASTLRISIKNNEIRDMGEALLKALNWFGVAMVEFKYDPGDGQYKLMEINPRFWGSLALAIASGVNFPYLLYRMACGETLRPVTSYRLGVMCRWLLPGDLLHYIRHPRRADIGKDFFSFKNPRLHYDILSWKDPAPTLARLLMPLTLLYDKDIKARYAKRNIAGDIRP
ncbi:MAG: ATP-grasp domain-containing protein [Desulfobacteraceae bacterium]|nr:ATP-grasp domain-containing protein [Desulfobacteraceae bacterium]